MFLCLKRNSFPTFQSWGTYQAIKKVSQHVETVGLILKKEVKAFKCRFEEDQGISRLF